MPFLHGADYLADWLLNGTRPVINGAPLTAQEVQSWASLMQIPIAPWEAEALLKMSRAYVEELDRSHDKDVETPPWE
jgi:hypothetical protein